MLHLQYCSASVQTVHTLHSLVVSWWLVFGTQLDGLLYQLMSLFFQSLAHSHLPGVETFTIMAVDRLRRGRPRGGRERAGRKREREEKERRERGREGMREKAGRQEWMKGGSVYFTTYILYIHKHNRLLVVPVSRVGRNSKVASSQHPPNLLNLEVHCRQSKHHTETMEVTLHTNM